MRVTAPTTSSRMPSSDLTVPGETRKPLQKCEPAPADAAVLLVLRAVRPRVVVGRRGLLLGRRALVIA